MFITCLLPPPVDNSTPMVSPVVSLRSGVMVVTLTNWCSCRMKSLPNSQGQDCDVLRKQSDHVYILFSSDTTG